MAQVTTEPATDPVEYRLAAGLVRRLFWLAIVLLVLLMGAATGLVLMLSAPPEVLVVLLVVAIVALYRVQSYLRTTAYVVRLDEQGYLVRLVRGAGVKRGAWADVRDAVAARPHDIPCLVLRLRDGTTTTVPVEALALDRDRFAADVKSRLEHAHRRRP